MYSTVPPWLRTSPPLIDALTGVPGQPFPAGSSKVVSFTAGVQSLFTSRLLSEDLTENACLSRSFLQTEYTTVFCPCQSPTGGGKAAKKPAKKQLGGGKRENFFKKRVFYITQRIM